MGIMAMVVPSNYDDAQHLNDICILRLQLPLKLGEETTRVAKIQLPPLGYSASGATNVTGWGLTDEGGSSSARLMSVRVPIVTDSQWSVGIRWH